MKRILIPTDFSSDSLDNIRNILNSLKDTRDVTEILLLNTYIVQQTDPNLVIGLNDKMKLESKSNLEKLRLELLENSSNALVSVATASHLGSLKNVVMQFIQKENFEQLAVTKEQELELKSIKELLRSKSCSLTVHPV